MSAVRVSCVSRPRAAGLAPPRAQAIPSRMQIVAFAKEPDESGSKEPKVDGEKLKKAIEKLRKDGVDDKVARKVLKTWEAQNVKDASGLKENLVKKSAAAVGMSVVQLVTDGVAAYCSTATAAMFSQADFPGSAALAVVFQFIFFYFFFGALFDLYRIGTVLGTAASMRGDSRTLYAAVLELAGDRTGLGLVDKAQAAVSSTKIVLALNSVRRVLREEMDGAQFTSGTLAQLNAYFVLQHAENTYGWKISDVEGLTKEDATTAAGLFARYDANDDYKLEMSEFKKLCDEAEFTLTEDEIRAAMALLDQRGSGTIEFDEFVAWWSGVHETPMPALQS